MPPVFAITTPTDPELVRAAQGGDQAALEALARRWWPVMRRWAKLELGAAELAEDAVQAVSYTHLTLPTIYPV